MLFRGVNTPESKHSCAHHSGIPGVTFVAIISQRAQAASLRPCFAKCRERDCFQCSRRVRHIHQGSLHLANCEASSNLVGELRVLNQKLLLGISREIFLDRSSQHVQRAGQQPSLRRYPLSSSSLGSLRAWEVFAAQSCNGS